MRLFIQKTMCLSALIALMTVSLATVYAQQTLATLAHLKAEKSPKMNTSAKEDMP